MMAVPFVYFSLLAFVMYRKRKKMDLAILICIIYATSGLIGLFMGDPGSQVKGYHISFFAAFSYCFLLTLCLLPISRFSHLRIKYIYPVKNVQLLKTLAWIAFIWFFIYAYASWNQFYGIITGDLGALRTALYEGTIDNSFILSVPFPIRLFISLFSYVFGCYWILIFLAFYCLLVQKLPIKYFLFFMIASLACPWGAVLGVDRSAVAGYMFSLIGVEVFFWPLMQKTQKKWTVVAGGIVMVALMVYLGMMTISRFGGVNGDDTDAVNSSVLFYLGHSYLYFCYYFDTFDNPAKMLNLLFPFISKFIFGSNVLGGMRINAYLEQKAGGSYGYFYTFIGQIQITAGHIVAILFCFILFFVGYNVLSKMKKGVATPKYAFLYFFFASFMLLGLFAYYYQSPVITSSVVVFLILFNWMGYEKVPIELKPSRSSNNNLDQNVKQDPESPERPQARDGADSGNETVEAVK